MTLPLSLLIASTITLVILTGVFVLEDRRGRMMFASGVRRWLNARIVRIVTRVSQWHPYIGKGFFRLMLHYVVHTILKRILRLVRRIEQGIEHTMRRNRLVAKSIDTEKRAQTHLEAIAEHRVETALSEREKQRRRSHN